MCMSSCLEPTFEKRRHSSPHLSEAEQAACTQVIAADWIPCKRRQDIPFSSYQFIFLFWINNNYSTDMRWCLLYRGMCLGMVFLLLRLQSIQGPGARATLVFPSSLSPLRFITDSWGKGCKHTNNCWYTKCITVNSNQNHDQQKKVHGKHPLTLLMSSIIFKNKVSKMRWNQYKSDGL